MNLNTNNPLDNIDVMDISTVEMLMAHDNVNLQDGAEIAEWLEDNNCELVDLVEVAREYDPKHWETMDKNADVYQRFIILHYL